jgi:diacylglycerol kinase family enzyme
VIYNPAAGRGRAARLLAKGDRRIPAGVVLRPTTGTGNAENLARLAADEGFARVVAAGGDGTSHEVANGLLASTRADVLFSTWPLGSMNDFAFTLGLDKWWRAGATDSDLATMAADVGVIEAGGRRRYFVNGCGIGFNGMVTTEARKVRWLRGVPLYAYAVLRALVRHFAAPPTAITLDGATSVAPTLAFSLGLGQREGGFPLTPLARLDDGRFDYLRVGDIRRWELLRHFPGMVTGNLPVDHPKVAVGRCSTVEVRSERPLCVHTDGEFFCTPADGVRQVFVSIIPSRLRVECFPPALYGGSAFDHLVPRLGPRLSRVVTSSSVR